MATSIGMFGPDEEDIRAQINNENNVMARSSPDLVGNIGALFNSGLYTAAEALGGGDPRIVKAKKMEQVKQYAMQNAKGNDTISYYKSLAEAFKKFGMMDEAYRVEMAIAALEDKDLDRQVKKEGIEANKETRLAAIEARKAALEAKAKVIPGYEQFTTMLKAISEGDPESEAAALSHFIATKGEDPQGALAKIKAKKDVNGMKTLGTTPEGLAVYRDNDATMQYVLQDGKKVPYYGAIKPVGGTNISLTNTADVRQGAEVGGNQYQAGTDAAGAASEAISSINQVRDLALAASDYFGPTKNIADAVAYVSRVFGTELKGSNEAQVVDQLMKDITLGKATNLKGTLSDKDMQFLKEGTANRGNSIRGFLMSLDALRKKKEKELQYGRLVEKERLQEGKPLAEIPYLSLREKASQDIEKEKQLQGEFAQFLSKKARENPRFNELLKKGGPDTENKLWQEWLKNRGL